MSLVLLKNDYVHLVEFKTLLTPSPASHEVE